MKNNHCEHKWIFGGLRWHPSDYPIPGSGAKHVYVEDWFYCEKCTLSHYKNERIIGNTYQKIPDGVLPK